MPRLISGKIKKTPSANADPNRYSFLDLQNAEPDLGVPSTDGSMFTSATDGTRTWSDTITIAGNVATINTLEVTGDSNLGNITATNVIFTGNDIQIGSNSTVKLTGGLPGQFLVTDGTGNLFWSMTSVSANASGISNEESSVVVPGPNSDILMTVAGTVGVVRVSDTAMTVTGNVIVSDNILANTINSTGNITAPYFVGDLIGNFAGNIVMPGNTGEVIFNNNSTAAASNAFSFDAVSNVLTVSGNVNADFFNGEGSALANINANSITSGTLSSDRLTGSYDISVTSAAAAGTVTVNAQPNITSVGTLSSLGVSGDIAGANITANTKLVTDSITNKSGNLVVLSNANILLSTTGAIDAGSSRITSVATPTSDADAATKAYVDNLVSSGIHYHQPVRVESPTALSAIYDNGTAGVGATLTNSGANVALTVDGISLNTNDRVLIYQQANAAHNGVYVVTVAGDESTAWVLTRASDADTYQPSSINGLDEGSYFFVQEGVTGAGESYVCSTLGIITFGTTPINFAQFSKAPTYTAGTGLGLYGNNEFYVANTTVTAGSYGNSESVATFTVNSQGQLTAASNTMITANAANLTGSALSSTVVSSNLTSVGNLTGLVVSGNANISNLAISGTIDSDGNVTAPYFLGNLIGDISGNLNIPGANGEIIFNKAGIAGTSNAFVFNNSLNVLDVNGNIVAKNITANTGVFAGNGSGLTSLTGANVTGTVANATYAVSAGTADSATTASNVITNAQPNITSVGNLTGLIVEGNANVTGNLITGGTINSTGNVTAPYFIGNVVGNVSGNISGNIIIPGANGEIIFNKNDSAAASNAFSFNDTSNTLVVVGDIVAVAVSGDGSGLVNLNANTLSTGTIPNARLSGSYNISVTTAGSATTAGTVTSAAQPNITSVGALTSLTVAGNITANSAITATGNITAPYFIGNVVGNISGNISVPGSNGEVIFNNAGNVGASNAFSFNTSSNVLTVNGNVSAKNFIGNVTTAVTVSNAAQPNITSVGTLTSLGVSGTVTASAFTANTGVFTGNGSGLLNIPGTSVNGTVANATYAVTAGSTTTAGTVTANAQGNITSVGALIALTVTGNTNLSRTSISSGTATSNLQALTVSQIWNNSSVQFSAVRTNITDTASAANSLLIDLAVAGDSKFSVSKEGNVFFSGVIAGNGSGLSAIAGGNVTGTVANATYATSAGSATTATSATTAGTVTTNAQPNITSVGTLSSLSVTGNISGANLTGNHYGNGSALSSITGANVTGTVANATYATSAGSATSATTAGTVTTAAQPNITSVGTLTSLTVSGNISTANITASGYYIRSVGTGISAAGTVQGDATVINKEINLVTTVSAGQGVRLPTAVAGMAITIINTTATALLVYPHTSGDINGAATNIAFSQPGGATLQFVTPNTTDWYTVGATFA